MKRSVSIIGGGPSALMLGAELNSSLYDVCIYEKNKTPGRKFLVAGDGGLNLTHSEAPELFIKRYTPHSFISEAFHHFSNIDFISWLNKAGIETFVGSSKRVFPKRGIKPITVLDVLIKKVLENKTRIFYQHEWIGFSENHELAFNNRQGQKNIRSDIVIFCLGGASWPVTGSNGSWLETFRKQGIQVNDFQPSNCAYRVAWPENIISELEGHALKNISVSCGEAVHQGEIVLTRFGIEGSGIYPLSPQIREGLQKQKEARIVIDLKPFISEKRLLEKLKKKPAKVLLSKWLKDELKLSGATVSLIKAGLSKVEFLDSLKLAKRIKQLPLSITGAAPLEEAISSVGGISLTELDRHFQLTKKPGIYVVGEMLDYDAPTGGYLLQSCFSMGKYLADYLNTKK